jgi:hypothetical protein
MGHCLPRSSAAECGLTAMALALASLGAAMSPPFAAADEITAPADAVRIEPLGPLVSRCSLPGEGAEDGMFPAHPCGIQLARDRFLILYATRGIRCHDDDGSIVYQVRAGGYDGPVLREHFLAQRIDDWDPFGDGSKYVKLLRHPVAFGVPKAALIANEPAAHGNVFAACWAVQAPGRLDPATGTYAFDRDVAERSIRIEWAQFRLNEAGDDIEILEPPALLRQRGYESGPAFSSHETAVTINQSLVPPVAFDRACTEWAAMNHLSTGITACRFRFDPERGRYAWVETGPPLPPDPGYEFSEGALAPMGDGWVVAIRARRRNAGRPDWSGSTSRDRGDTAWVRTADPFRELPPATIVQDPHREAPLTVFRCADGVLRMFSGDLDHSPHRQRRDPLYAWDVDPRDFSVSRRQVVLDSVAGGLFPADGPLRGLDFACVFPHVGGRSQLVAHRVLLYRYRAGVVADAPAVTPEEFGRFGIYYARITYPEPQPAAWTFASGSRD